MRSNIDFGEKIMTKWEHINNKRSHSHLSKSHSRPILISLSNLVPVPMGIPREGWESRISLPMHISNLHVLYYSMAFICC